MIHFLHHNDTFFACHFRGLSCILFPPSGKLPSHHMEAAWDQVSYEFFPVFFLQFLFSDMATKQHIEGFPKIDHHPPRRAVHLGARPHPRQGAGRRRRRLQEWEQRLECRGLDVQEREDRLREAVGRCYFYGENFRFNYIYFKKFSQAFKFFF